MCAGEFTLQDFRGVSTTFENQVTKQIIRQLRDDAPDPITFDALSSGSSVAAQASDEALVDALLYLSSGSFIDPIAAPPEN